MTESLYRLVLAPKTAALESRRQEFMLNILLLGAVSLAIAALVITAYNSVALGASYKGAPPVVSLAVGVIFFALLAASRYGWHRPVAYVFTGAFFLAATFPLVAKGVIVMETVLLYSLAVVMTGVLINTRAAFVMASLMSVTVLIFIYLNQSGTLHTDPSLITRTTSYGDGILCAVIFSLIALVSWLANRDIRQALKRAQASEMALRLERDNLEMKVRERTKALEKAQLAHTLQLQRFAEFGRVSATLIHDLASPLTAVSLSLAQIEDRRRNGLLEEAKQSTAAMERYVVAARHELQQESEVTDFNPASELRSHVLPQCRVKAKQTGVRLEIDLAGGITVHGSSVQFDHIASNLIANAIDAYEDTSVRRTKLIIVRLWQQGKQVRLTVRDRGIGIEPHQLPRIFDAFYTTKYASENLGLGLATVKHLVEAGFGGTISARSSRRSGTRFTVKIPLP